jgi:hypothetical protein
MRSPALLSPCRRYRFALWRRWDIGPQVLFVMLNPSTADEAMDDPTIRRCIGLARSWGFSALAVGNLFAYRTTSPADLSASADPVGSKNDHWLHRLHEESSLTIAAWGITVVCSAGALLSEECYLVCISSVLPSWVNLDTHSTFVPV